MKKYSQDSSSWVKNVGEVDLIQIKDAIEIAKQYAEETEQSHYFGWCDVWGCLNEGCSGGNAWGDGGYWTVCVDHAQDYRDGKPQPKMKTEAVNREYSRNKKTGYLPSATEKK